MPARVYKTRQFARDASKRRIGDAELCQAISEVEAGRAENLGGGVYKKRLNDNMDRALIVAKVDRFWIFVHLFQKSDRANISPDLLSQLKRLSKSYAALDENEIAALTSAGTLLEICNGD